MNHPPVTDESILEALDHAAEVLKKDPVVTSTEQTAGFILEDGSEQGFQVFVKVYRYSQPLLQKSPLTGGLLANAQK